MFGEGSSIQLARVFGVRIGASPSWFFVLFVFIYLLSDQFRGALGGSTTEAYVVAVFAALAFFLSIIVHELGHAWAARRQGITVHGVDLWFFGGIAKLSRDSESPGEEFKVAIAGPIATLGVVILCFAGVAALDGVSHAVDVATLESGSAGSPAQLLLGFVGGMNALIFVFNLLPAFPLDGGRIARAIAWKITGQRGKATVIAARLGQAFGYLLIGWGAYTALVLGDPFGGVWWGVLGWLIAGSARGAAVSARVTDRLEGITVEDIMDSEPVTMPATTRLIDAEEEFFSRGDWDWYPVVDEDRRFLGVARRESVEQAIGSGMPALSVGELMDPADPLFHSVETTDPLEAALGSEPLRRLGAIMAVDPEGRLRGVLTVEQLHRALTAAVPGRP